MTIAVRHEPIDKFIEVGWIYFKPSVYVDLVAISSEVDSILLLLLVFLSKWYCFWLVYVSSVKLCIVLQECVCVYIHICFLLGPIYLNMESPVLKPLSLIIYWVIMTTPGINLGDKVNVQNVILVIPFSPLLHTEIQ